MPRSPELASRSDSRLLVVDVQEKLVPHIDEGERMVENCRRLVVGAGQLGVPVVATEQYPRGLGPTVEPLRSLVGAAREKLRFSAWESLGWGASAQEAERFRVIVVGVEAHVCVQQTVLDLISQGYRVYVPVDAIGSRNPIDKQWAVERMSVSGAMLTTTEALLFEWCETAEAAEFKAISRLVTGR